MTALDCADPSMRVDKRNETLTPLQALALLNNGLTVAMARHFAERVQREADGLEAQVTARFRPRAWHATAGRRRARRRSSTTRSAKAWRTPAA